MTTIKIALFLPALLLAHSNTIWADDFLELSFEDLLSTEVSSASKYTQTVKQAPSAVKIITAEQIELFGWQNLDQALATLPGMFTFNDGSYSYLGARGLMIPGDYNTRMLLLVDGIPFNDSIYGQATIENSFPLDLSLVEKIEYVPGPGSAIYGPHAMFGVINVITKSVDGKQYATTVTVDTDNHHRSRIKANFMHQFENGNSIIVAAKQMHKSGQDKSYPGALDSGLTDSQGNALTSTTVQNQDSAKDKEFFAKFRADDLTLSFMYGDRLSKPSNPLYWTNFNDNGLINHERYTSVSAVYDTQLDNGNVWYSSINYQQLDYKGDFPYYDGGRYINVDETTSQRWLAESRLTMTQIQNHTVLVGLEARTDSQSDFANYDEGEPDFVYFDKSDRQTNIAAYLQDDWQLAKNWTLNLGGRIDNSNVYGTHLSPRAGLIWQTSSTLVLKALGGIAYRAPIPYESSYGTDPAIQDPGLAEEYLSNEQLKEETITTQELVIHWTPTSSVEWVNSLYHYKLSDIIAQSAVGDDFQYQQSTSIKAYGLESDLRYKLNQKWILSANLNLQHTEDSQGDRLDNSPVWVAKFLAQGAIWQDRLNLALEVHGMGPYQQDWFGETISFDSTVISNVALTAITPVKGLDVQLRIDNLFDRDFDISAGLDSPIPRLPDDGIEARLSLKYQF